MDALATAAEEAAKAAEEMEYDNDNDNEEGVAEVDAEEVIDDDEDDDDLPKAQEVEEVVDDLDYDYEVNEWCFTAWNQNQLFQVKNICCANSFCSMKGVSVPLSKESNRCIACGFAAHHSCRVQLKDHDQQHKVCKLCCKIEGLVRSRTEIEISDELQEELLKNKMDIPIEFVSKKRFNEILLEYEDGIHEDVEENSDDQDGSDGKFFIR